LVLVVGAARNNFRLTTQYFLARFLRSVGSVSLGYNARMRPIFGSMV
jgi:hypothetical protein